RAPAARDELCQQRVPAQFGGVVLQVEVVHDGEVNSRQAESLQAVFVGALYSIVRVVELDLESQAAGPRPEVKCRQVARSARSAQHATYLGGNDKCIARTLAQQGPHAELAEAATVPWRGVEVTHASIPGRVQRRLCLRLRQWSADAADRRAAK